MKERGRGEGGFRALSWADLANAVDRRNEISEWMQGWSKEERFTWVIVCFIHAKGCNPTFTLKK